MNLHEITFQLNESEKIIIELNEPLSMVHCCYEAPLFFVTKTEKIQIDSADVRYYMHQLQSLLVMALDNQLQLHESVQDYIGYFYAQYMFYWYDREIAKEFGLIFDEDNRWVGNKHLLFAYDIAIWMYNDADGAIVLEFTPWYTQNRFDEEGETDFTQYDSFLKNYKTLFSRTISCEVAEQWLTQANQILQQIADNIERFSKKKESK